MDEVDGLECRRLHQREEAGQFSGAPGHTRQTGLQQEKHRISLDAS